MATVKNRHDFREADKKLLAERVGYHCSNPACGVATVGPSDISNQKEYIGVAAHIYSASISGGPRANKNLTEKERGSIDNGIHLCNKCSTLIDKNNGQGYPPRILFSWKGSAESAAKGRIYQNNPCNIFRKVVFSNLEEQYSTALTCSGLNEKNILSCPSNKPTIREITNKLNLANKCILMGSSGSGKSLLTYQTAYELHKCGWNIFKINKEAMSNSTVLAAPLEKSVVLIDDAQTIESSQLEDLLGNAFQECAVLANWNTSAESGETFSKKFPTVSIVSSAQVDVLEKFCVENKAVIADTLRSIGISVKSNNYHDCIERRIERASKEKTPWLFNYNLSEGWSTAKADFKLLKENQNQHFVLVTVAAFQYATLDYGVKEEVIIDALRNFNNSSDWIEKSRKTIRDKCSLQDQKVRNKHYEYSRKILEALVANESSKEDKQFLVHLLKDILKSEAYDRGHSNILEFILFKFHWCRHKFNNDGFTQELTEELLDRDVTVTAAQISKLNSLIRMESSVILFLQEKSRFIESWVLACSRDTAYQLGDLVNTLYNEKYGCFKSGKLLFDQLLDKLVSCEVDDRSRYSNLINRSFLLMSEEGKNYASKKLEKSSFSLSVSGTKAGIECFHFASVVKDLYVISNQWSDQQVARNIEGIANLFNSDFSNAQLYFHELLNRYFGLTAAILGIYHATPTVKKYGRELAQRIDIKEILGGFEQINATEIQGYSNILIFLALYDQKKLKDISEKFNYTKLESTFTGVQRIDHYHRALISLLCNPNSVGWKKHVFWIINSVDYVEHIFFVWDADLAINRLRQGILYKLSIHMCSDCERELIILKGILEEEGQELLKRVLFENKENIENMMCTNAQNGDNHKSKFNFLVFIGSNHVLVFQEILNSTKNCKIITGKLDRLLRGKKWERIIARLYVYLIRKHAADIPEEITSLERRFPSIRRFDIEQYID